jgi:hypothetical protein
MFLSLVNQLPTRVPLLASLQKKRLKLSQKGPSRKVAQKAAQAQRQIFGDEIVYIVSS